jgi:hypothetical protein
MTPDEARDLAQSRLAERRQRVHTIRGRTIAAATATFALAWGIVFAQLVSGDDPALGHGQTTSKATTATTTSAAAATTTSAAPATTDTSPAPTPVTTAQS